MAKIINIKINDKNIKAKEGETILGLAYRNGIQIPNLCYHPDNKVKANCRVCVVEVNGARNLKTACSTQVFANMEIKTNSSRVKKSRKMNLELIFAEHIEKCPTCPLRPNCKLLKYAKDYGLRINRFKDRKRKRKVYKFANAVELDGTQCIDCRNCIEVCKRQTVDFLTLKDRGYKMEVVPANNGKHDCVYCGQCSLHCPVTSAQEQLHYIDVENLLKNKGDKILVAQITPSIRASIGEMFGLPYGKVVTGKLISALREMGFDYVFDYNFGLDITAILGSKEFLERKIFPLFTSSCPAWVRFVEFYYPEFIPNLSKVRSPRVQLAGVIKSYWASKNEINPKNIVIASIAPCTGKKFESKREELKMDGVQLIDYSLTTREFGYLMERKKIDLANIKSTPPDCVNGFHSCSDSINTEGSGVTESLLQTVCAMLKGSGITCVDFKKHEKFIRSSVADCKFNGKKMKVAIIKGLDDARRILEELKEDPQKYRYIEVLACPNGCVGGGGQPIPTTSKQIKKRKECLSFCKKMNVRAADKNLDALGVMKWIDGNKGLRDKIFYTSYYKVKKPEALNNKKKKRCQKIKG